MATDVGTWPFDFRGEVAAILRAIPAGRSVTLTAIAEALGDPLARGAVEDFLRRAPPGLPLHLVLDDEGRPLAPAPPGAAPGEPQRGPGAAGEPIPWAAPLRRLREEQEALARRALLRDDFEEARGIAGADVAYRGDRARGAAVVLDSRGKVRARSTAEVAVEFPYIPTYLAYREFPALAAALEPLRPSLGVLMVEGHGALHPRGAGLATFAGVTLDLPTIGVAKGPLGFPPAEPLPPGEARPVELRGRILGYALGIAGRRRPIYISPGHRISPGTALGMVAAQCRGRMPEPLRLADGLAREKERGKGV